MAVLAILAVAAFSLDLLIPSREPVSLRTDETRYCPGETVTVTILVSRPLNADMIWLYIDDPDSISFEYASLQPSSQNYTFKLPVDAQLGPWSIIVTWDHEMAQTYFNVEAQPIVEFPASSLIIFLALAASLALLAGRRKMSAYKSG